MLFNRFNVVPVNCMMVIALLSVSCNSSPLRPHDISNCKNINDMKIGLLADSQLQTLKTYKEVLLYVGEIPDRIVDVSIRPSGLNLLSPDMLRYFLDQLQKRNVNVIFYLGDSANNGCTDELDGVFAILRKFRDEKNIPIYFVLGNHDYLGAGNTPYRKDRKKLCGDDNVTDKFQLMLRVHEFNKGNPKNTPWSYKDNFDDIKDIKAKEDDCKLKKCEMDDIKKALAGKTDCGLRNMGCFLAAILKYKDKDGPEFFLMDTSDYHGKWFIPTDIVLKKKWFGMSGWISDEQMEYFEKNKSKENPPSRTFVTHYPATDLAVTDKKLNKEILAKLSSLYTGSNQKRYYWLSAHTHAMPKIKKIKMSEDITAEHLNIGSTTDTNRKCGYFPPHAAVVQFCENKIINMSDMSAEYVTFYANKIVLNDMYRYIREESKNLEGKYLPVNKKSDGIGLFGLDKSYRDWEEKRANTDHANRNLVALIGRLKEKFKTMEESEIRTALGVYSSGLEAKYKTDKIINESVESITKK